jgi:hypothetical protein
MERTGITNRKYKHMGKIHSTAKSYQVAESMNSDKRFEVIVVNV